jgi:dihydrofolate reductase
MRRLVVSMITSLDGFIAGPNGELDWIIADSDLHKHSARELEAAEAIVLGRKIYQALTPYWDDLDLSDPGVSAAEAAFARGYRATPRFVVSRTLDGVEEHATLISEDAGEAISQLKREGDGEISLGCGPELLGALAKLDLIDEYRLLVMPVALGRGIPLFGRIQESLPLRLVATQTFDTGVMFNGYVPA